MNTSPSPQDKPGASSSGTQRDKPIQTGARSGGEPGEGVNTSASAPGQSNVDAAVAEGTEYGEKKRSGH